MGNLSDFEIEHFVGARLAGASVRKPPHYKVYRQLQFLRLSRHTRIIGR
jgi:hypothetical protein